MIVADSDVLIDFLRGREPSTSRVALEIRAGRLATTAINEFELLSGGRSRPQREKTRRLLAALSILPLDSRAGRAAAAVRRELEAGGQGIATADYLIAGVCLSRSTILLTRNRSHFERVPGLMLGTLT